MWHRYYTLARCSVVLIISTFMTPLRFPKGSSSFVNKSMRLSAIFADLKMVLKTSKIGAAQHFREKQRANEKEMASKRENRTNLTLYGEGLVQPREHCKENSHESQAQFHTYCLFLYQIFLQTFKTGDCSITLENQRKKSHRVKSIH